jgi:hypothetical protein
MPLSCYGGWRGGVALVRGVVDPGSPYWAARPVRSVILSYSSRAVVLPSPPPSSSNKRGGEALVHGVVDPRVGVLIGYSTAGHPLAQFTRGGPPRSSPIQFRFPISNLPI